LLSPRWLAPSSRWPGSCSRRPASELPPPGSTPEAPADIFKGDAPSGELWELWQKRGWVKEAAHYLKLGRNVQCKVCPNNCMLEPGDRSHCRNKVNRDGTLYTLVYGNPCTFHVDPVEKKPLFHFLPGSRRRFRSPRPAASSAASTARTGRFRRRNRRKPRTRAARNCACARRCREALTLEQMARLSLFPEDVVAVTEALGCPSISYTYSEPTAFYEYTQDTCKAARERKLKNIVVSCGSIEDRPRATCINSWMPRTWT
jgi:pyruvate formate lyase activating enzyme